MKRWLGNGLESANALDYNWVLSEGIHVLRLKKVLAIVGLGYEYVCFNWMTISMTLSTKRWVQVMKSLVQTV